MVIVCKPQTWTNWQPGALNQLALIRAESTKAINTIDSSGLTSKGRDDGPADRWRSLKAPRRTGLSHSVPRAAGDFLRAFQNLGAFQNTLDARVSNMCLVPCSSETSAPWSAHRKFRRCSGNISECWCEIDRRSGRWHHRKTSPSQSVFFSVFLLDQREGMTFRKT